MPSSPRPGRSGSCRRPSGRSGSAARSPLGPPGGWPRTGRGRSARRSLGRCSCTRSRWRRQDRGRGARWLGGERCCWRRACNFQSHPYRAGCETRDCRPLPKVRVAATMATASTDPSNAERTGTAVGPCPGSRARRTPTTAGAGRSEQKRMPSTTTTSWRWGRSFRQRSAEPHGAALPGRPGRWPHRPEPCCEHCEANAEHRPVEGDARVGIDGTYRPQG